MSMCPFISMLMYSKIKFVIDKNNDDLLKTISKHGGNKKRKGKGILLN